MASNTNEKLDPEEEELMRKEMENLQLQQKRMKSLVDQRRQERQEMEKELLRMERMKKHMEEMCKENEVFPSSVSCCDKICCFRSLMVWV